MQGVLQYVVDIDDGTVDWELINHDSERYISIVLKKKSPLERTVQWWSCVFQGDQEIDVTAIAERKLITQDFKDVWNEAHRMFREKIANSGGFGVSIPAPEDQSSP